MRSFVDWIKNCDAHHRLFVSLAMGLAVALAIHNRLSVPLQLVLVWDAFLLGLLGLAWVRIITARPKESLKTAKLQDSSRSAIFLFVVLAACASIFAVGYLLDSSAHGAHGERLMETVLLAFGTLVGSWSLVHTLFALRYAHIYYGDAEEPTTDGHAGGLEFPHDRTPDYLDFAYFSFVIGMTCQVSDVQISGRIIRRLALVHGLLSFMFNTIILALSINVVSGLLAG